MLAKKRDAVNVQPSCEVDMRLAMYFAVSDVDLSDLPNIAHHQPYPGRVSEAADVSSHLLSGWRESIKLPCHRVGRRPNHCLASLRDAAADREVSVATRGMYPLQRRTGNGSALDNGSAGEGGGGGVVGVC